MKLVLSILLFVAVTFAAFAQSPEKMSYQAIVRAPDNSLIVNSNISLKVIIRQGSPSGNVEYQESHSVNTNNNGLVSLEIGTGKATTGSFNTISWGTSLHFIETQVDVNGGNQFNIIGISQLLSVPYALHSKTAEKIIGANGLDPYKALIIPFKSSRNIATSDVNNTIECTSTSTLTLTSGFSTMLVGDTVNLEAHNGAVLTIQASSGVTINYNSNGSANFSSTTGNVSFGFLRKTGANSYIISGQ